MKAYKNNKYIPRFKFILTEQNLQIMSERRTLYLLIIHMNKSINYQVKVGIEVFNQLLVQKTLNL